MSAVSSVTVAFATLTRRSTQQTLAVFFAAIMTAAIVALTVSFVVIGQIHKAAQTIGVDTEPSIVAAEKIATYLGAMDADVANEALTGAQIASSQDYRADTTSLSNALIDAARNITYPEETPPILSMQDNLHSYYETLGDARAVDADNLALTHQIEIASNILHSQIITSSQALMRANLDPLTDAYVAYKNGSTGEIIEEYCALLVLFGLLVWAQIYLSSYSKRTLNWPMACATVILVLASGWIWVDLLEARVDMKVAKEDAFDSIHPLHQAQAALYTMNADESLWLLDLNQGHWTYDSDFTANAKLVLDTHDMDAAAIQQLSATLASALAAEKVGNVAEARHLTPKLAGFLGDEMNNVTFGQEEREPATRAVTSFINYLGIDKKIRLLEVAGKHQAAINLDIGTKEGESDWAFTQTDQAIESAIKVNEDVFKERIQAVLLKVRVLTPVMLASLILTVALSGFGLYQRYKEFL